MLNYLEYNGVSCTLYSDIPFSKTLYHIETSQSICKAIQLNGFYMIRVFTERNFPIDYS